MTTTVFTGDGRHSLDQRAVHAIRRSAILFVGCAVGKVTIEQVMRKIWPFYGVMVMVPMAVTYLPEISLWLPRHVLR